MHISWPSFKRGRQHNSPSNSSLGIPIVGIDVITQLSVRFSSHFSLISLQVTQSLHPCFCKYHATIVLKEERRMEKDIALTFQFFMPLICIKRSHIYLLVVLTTWIRNSTRLPLEEKATQSVRGQMTYGSCFPIWIFVHMHNNSCFSLVRFNR